MNEKIKKTFRAMTSAALAGAFVVSSVIGGGADSFVGSSVVFAEESNENTLGDGTYIVPVQTINWNTGNVLNTSKSVPYAPRCILNVDGNENTITMKIKADVVAAWYLDSNLNAQFPKIRNLWKSFGTDIRDSFDKLATDNKGSYGASKYTFDEANNGNYNPINIEKNNFDDTWCYVTFSVSDYSEKICTVFWMENLALGDSNDVMQNMKLDIDNAFLVSELNEKIANGKAGVTFEEARSITNKSGHSLAESQELKSIFSGIASVEKTDDVYVTSIDLNTNQLSGSDIVEVNAFTSRSYVADSIYNNFIPFNTIYGDKLLQDGKYLDATFNEDSLIYGLDITVETEAVQIEKAESSTGDYNGYFGTLCLNPYDVVDVTINDTNQTGVYVTGLSNVLPESSVLKVVKDRSADEYPDSLNFTRRSITEWSGDMYNDPKHWFYIELTDAEGNDLANYDGITLHIPVENPDNYDVSGFVVFGYREADSLLYSSDEYGYEKYGSIKEITDSSGNKTYEFQYTNSLGQLNIQNSTFGYMRQGEYDDLHSKVVSGDDDGIYTATGMLQKFGTRGTSMANAAVDPNVMFTINNGEIKFYFVSDYMNVMFNEAYIGELLSYDVSHDGVWFDDSVSYTNFDIDENGNLTSNFGYDPITEAANVKGGIITLREETYDTVYGCYDLAVVSPAMLALSGTSYADLQKDQLTVHLRTTDLTKVADYSEENVQKYIMEKGYGYHPSALLRKIKQAEIINNIGANTVNAGTAFADAYTVYNKADATSQEIEAAINALDATATDKLPSAKVTGYSLTAKEDFGLHLFVDLGYDAQNDANTAVKFNIGGTEKTIAVSDATFVEGKGYEFVLDVPAKKMYDEITAEIVLSDGAEVIGDPNLGTYSVAGYLNDYLADSTKTELDALAQATLTYGAYADKFFNGSTDAELADVSAVTIDDVAQYKHNINVAEEGIEFIGAALTLESKTSIKLYFKVDEDNLYDITDFAFTVNGNKAEPEKNGDYYYITVPKLTAGELAKAQTFTVNDAEFSYSPFSYVYAALADSDAEKEADLINLVKALYLYGVEAGKVA